MGHSLYSKNKAVDKTPKEADNKSIYRLCALYKAKAKPPKNKTLSKKVRARFYEKVAAIEHGAHYIDTEDDYIHAKRYMTKGGSVVAVKDNGDIVSVCQNKNDKEKHGSDLLRKAISEGGTKLDAFGEKLYKFYTKNGFEPVSWTRFNREYAPHDWKPEYGEKPVIFYKYTGKPTDITYEDFISRVKPHKDYFAAQEARDKEV